MTAIVEKMKSWGRRQSFQPGPLAIFINPFYFLRRGLYRHLKNHAKKLDGVLLDFGCGRKPYKNLFDVKEYVGVDIEKSGHSHELSEIDVYYDGRTIPFKDNHFDSVLCSEVFEHIFEIDIILREINRVMKKDAKILITVPFVWNDHEVPYDFGRYSTYGIRYLLEKHGFTVISIDKSTNFAETLCQLWMLYLHHVLKTKSQVVNSILNVFLISPFALAGALVSTLLPRRNDLYHNSIVLACKK
jgi:SAM-dependent methyltransferase